MKNNFITKIIGATLAFAMMIGGAVGINAAKQAKEVSATNYTKIATFDFDCAATPASSSAGLSAASDVQTYLNACTDGLTVTVSAKSGDVYKGKGSGGAGIPQEVLKIGKASGPGGFTFTVDGSDNVSKIVFNAYSWKTSTSVSINGGTAQTYDTALTLHAFEFELATPTKTIAVSVTSSALCVSSMELYKTDGQQGPTTYSVIYHDDNKTSGTAPTDSTEYESGQTVTVAGNTGNLVRTGYTWSGWSINQDGSGTAYGPAPYTTTYTVASANVNFYPIWVKNVTPLPESGTITINGNNTSLGNSYATNVIRIVEEDNTPGTEFGLVFSNVMKSSNNLQFKANEGVVYSTTPLNYIRNVTVSGTSSNQAVIKYGTTPNSGCTETEVGTENTYFKVSHESSGARYWTITVTYSLETPVVLSDLRIASGEDTVKKVYDDGDTFDPTGLVIQAKWGDNWDTENNVLDSIIWTPTILTGGTTSVTGTYSFGNIDKTVTINGLTVNSPVVIDGASNKPANIPSTANSDIGEGQINSSGVKYGYRALQIYNSNLEFNRADQNAYIGNNESYGKFIKKIRLTLTSGTNFDLVKMFKGDSPIPGGTEVSPASNTGSTRVYNFNNDSEFFTLKQSEVGTWIQVVKIEVFLGDNAPTINSVNASVKSGTYYATTTLSASDFDVTVTWTSGKADTHPTDEFTWTVNGNVNGALVEGENTIVLVYRGVSSNPFVINAAPARAKDVIETTLSTQALLKYHYSAGFNDAEDELTNALFGVAGSSYDTWSNKTSNSAAVYAGKSSGGNDGSIIQLRSSSSDSGIITTVSGGNVKSVTVTWNNASGNGKVLDIYGKNSAYSSPANLYNSGTKGTLLGSITSGTSTSITVDGDYSYIGIRSNSGALYLDSITIEWSATTYSFTNAAIKFGASISKTLWNDLNEQSTIVGYGVMLAKPSDLEGDFEIKDKYNSARNSAADVDGSFTDVAEKPYSLINNTAIKNYYNSISTSPVEDGDNYIWYLAKSVTGTDVGLTKSFTAVAYIRTVNDEIIFLDEITKSAAQIAKDDIDADPNDELDNDYLEGSLGYLAGLVA